MGGMRIIYLAGIDNSGAGHWQNHWYWKLNGLWVDHRDWAQPRAGEWLEDLDRTLALDQGPKVIVAHSMGCLLLSEWAKRHEDRSIRGAFLVGVPSAESPSYPKQAVGFSSPFECRFPFPTALVASRNDPYAPSCYSRALAEHWGSLYHDVGEKGHINLQSGLGSWDGGFQHFRAFVQSIERFSKWDTDKSLKSGDEARPVRVNGSGKIGSGMPEQC